MKWQQANYCSSFSLMLSFYDLPVLAVGLFPKIRYPHGNIYSKYKKQTTNIVMTNVNWQNKAEHKITKTPLSSDLTILHYLFGQSSIYT